MRTARVIWLVFLLIEYKFFQRKATNYLAGKFGTINGKNQCLKPFSSLNSSQLKEELQSRHVSTSETRKTKIMKVLRRKLKGCSRVPILLYHNSQNDIKGI